MANASMAAELPQYIDNLRGLLRRDYAVWRMVVERQVLATLLPKLTGNRAHLEPHLWALLVLCLDGHDAAAPALSEPVFEQAVAAAAAGQGLATGKTAPFPRAARGVIQAMLVLRETGVFPRPIVPAT